MGVSGCSNDINACHREDFYAREKLDEVVAQNKGAKPAPNSLTPSGPGYASAKAEWNATAGGARMAEKAARGAGKLGTTELVKKSAEKGLHKALRTAVERAKTDARRTAAEHLIKGLERASFVLDVYEGVKVVSEMHEAAVGDAKEQAQREMDGINRDAMRAFILAGTGDVFSPDYRAFVTRNVSQTSKDVASKMVTHATVDAGQRYSAEKTVMQAMAREGISRAKALGVDTPASLKHALEHDAKFREQYETSTAFRLGVGSVLYEAAKKAQG